MAFLASLLSFHLTLKYMMMTTIITRPLASIEYRTMGRISYRHICRAKLTMQDTSSRLAASHLQLKSWNYGQFSLIITRYWVNQVIWGILYKQNTNYSKEFLNILLISRGSSYTYSIVLIIPQLHQ